MIKPARGFVLIQPLEADEVSAGGVYVPERAKDLPNRGKVVAIGKEPLEWLESRAPDTGWEIRVGDIVYYKKFIDNKIKKEGKEYLIVPFSDILAIDG